MIDLAPPHTSPVGIDALLDQALTRGGLRIRPFEISLADAGVSLSEVLAHPRVRGVHTLEVARQDLDPSAVDALLAWPGLDRVRSLHVHLNQMGAEAILRLLRSPRLQQLHKVEMHSAEGNGLSEQEASCFVEELVHRTPLPNLRALRFGGHRAGAAAARAVGSFRGFPRLVSLDYGLAYGHGNALVAALVEHPQLAALRAINLDATGLDDEGIGLLLASGKTHALRDLSLRVHAINPRGFEQLAHDRGALPALERLTLSSGKDAGRTPVEVLARMKTPRLRWLDVGGAAISDDGLSALAGAPFFQGLRGLQLWGYPLERDPLVRFLGDPRLAKLHMLQLFPLRLDQESLTLFRERPRVLAGVLEQWLMEPRERMAS